MTRLLLPCLSFIVILGTCDAWGAPIIFFGEDRGAGESTAIAHPNADAARALFLSGLTEDVGTETFESFMDGVTPPLMSPPATFPGSSGGITATFTSPASFFGDSVNVKEVTPPDMTDGFGRFPISGAKFLNRINNESTNFDDFSLRITFDKPIAALGFYGLDLGDMGDPGSRLQLSLNNGSSPITVPSTFSDPPFGWPGGSVFFFGLIADPFTEVTFRSIDPITGALFPPGLDAYGIDDLTIGDPQQVLPLAAAVPEPAALAIWALMALFGTTYASRRWRSACIE